MYTFEDWLNDNFEEKEGITNPNLIGKFFLSPGMLEEFCYKHKMISEDCKDKILAAQENAYDLDIILYTQFYIKEFLKAINKAVPKYRNDVLELEIKKWEEEIYPAKHFKTLDQQQRNYEVNLLRCKKGEKDFHFIKGGQYKEVLKQYDNYQNDKPFNPVYLSGHLHHIKAILEYLEYLESFGNPNNDIMGLGSMLTKDQLKVIFEKATKLKYIECSEESFLYAFSHEKLPRDFEPIRWMLLSKKGKSIGETNKSALRDFISVCMSGKVGKQNIPRNVSKLFVDRKFKGLTLNKALAGGRSSSYAFEFEMLIK